MTRGRGPPTREQLRLEELSDANVITFYAEELAHYHATGRWPPSLTKTDRKRLVKAGALRRVGRRPLGLSDKALEALQL